MNVPLVGPLLTRALTGGRYLWRRRAYRRYIGRAAGILSREINQPSSSVERALRLAARRASRGSRRVGIKRILLGGRSEFATTIKGIAEEFPHALADELPHANLEPSSELAARCARALRAAVAAAPKDDVVAEEVLQADTRLGWRLLSASVVASTVTFVATGLGYEVKTGETTESLVNGMIAAASVGSVVSLSAAIAIGGTVRRAHDALHDLVDALFAQNSEVWEPLSELDRFRQRDVPLSTRITGALIRIVAATGSAGDKSADKAARREFLCRWDGDERNAIRAALKNSVTALSDLPFPDDWTSPLCVIDQVDGLLKSFPTKTRGAPSASDRFPDTLEDQLECGMRVLQALVCCAALASVLDEALGLEVTPAQQAA